MYQFNREGTISLLRGIWPQKKQAKEEQNVCIAEIILAMQESQLEDSLSFVQIVQDVSSVVNKARIKMHKPRYKVGDIVYLRSLVIDLNWKFNRFLDSPFVVVSLPVDTEKFKTYTLRLLDDESNEDCWVDYHYHEDFFHKRDQNA